FAPQPKRAGRAKWLIAGVLGAGAIGGGAYELWPQPAGTAAKLDAASTKQIADAMAVPTATLDGHAPQAAPAPDAAPHDAAEIDAVPAADAAVRDAGAPRDAGKPPAKRPKLPAKGALGKKKQQPPKVPAH